MPGGGQKPGDTPYVDTSHMQTSDRMMIAGLALQGLLANPIMSRTRSGEEIEENAAMALRYAAALEMKVPDEQGEPRIVTLVRICSVAYNVYALGVDVQEGLEPEHIPANSRWPGLDDDTKQTWLDATEAVLCGLDPAEGLNPAARAILKAVVAGWLDADG